MLPCRQSGDSCCCIDWLMRNNHIVLLICYTIIQDGVRFRRIFGDMEENCNKQSSRPHIETPPSMLLLVGSFFSTLPKRLRPVGAKPQHQIGCLPLLTGPSSVSCSEPGAPNRVFMRSLREAMLLRFILVVEFIQLAQSCILRWKQLCALQSCHSSRL
jgi:hypothetical protein